jgi:hypothetical protein
MKSKSFLFSVNKVRLEALTNLHEFIDVPLLQESFDTLNKKGASGSGRPNNMQQADILSELKIF